MAAQATTPTITVLGAAVRRTEPDEAVLWIVLSALVDAPGAALADVSARGQQLVAALDELGVPKADRSTTGISVEEEFDHTEQGRRSLGHRATARVLVRLADPALVGRLVARATEDFAARIEGLRWAISLSNPVRLEVARLAAADARRKAEAYADGAGARLGPLIGLSEPGTSPPVQIFAATGFGGPARQARRPPPMPVEAGEHEVEASIEATFALELD